MERKQLLRWTAGFAIFVALVIALDAPFRLFEPQTHPLSTLSDAKVSLYRTMLTDGVDYDTVAVGSSLIQSGFNPSSFPGRAMNAGIGGNFVADRQLKAVREILEHKNPKLLIYGVENFALSGEPISGPLDDKPKTQFVDWLKSHNTQKNLLDWIQGVRAGIFSLPAFIPETVISRRFSSYDRALLHASGWLEVHAIGTPKFLPQTADVEYSKTQIAAFRKIIELAAAAGVRLVVVQMPTFSDLIAVNPSWYRRFSDFIRSETSKAGVPFLDYEGDERFPFRDIKYYYDTNHLNADGSIIFTRLLTSDLHVSCLSYLFTKPQRHGTKC